MGESQLEGVQQVAWSNISCQLSQTVILALTISGVTNQGMAEELKVHADLVCAPRMKRGLDEGCPPQTAQHAITGAGFPPQIIVHRHSLAMRTMPGNCRPNFTSLPLNFTANR